MLWGEAVHAKPGVFASGVVVAEPQLEFVLESFKIIGEVGLTVKEAGF